MPLAYIERLIKDSTGLDPDAMGAAAIERAVRLRQRAVQIVDMEEYCDLVAESRPELQALIDSVVVAETWFFRDVEAFAALVRFVREVWMPANPSGVLRMLSLPCASGEEPYSMAIALIDAGVPMDRFSVDAVDLSQRALVHGRQGVFGRNAFRTALPEGRRRHFSQGPEGWSVSQEVGRKVQFIHGNLFSPSLLQGAQPYDVIFCRNLLIYFDRAAQDRAIDVVSGLLRPNGVVFVGPSETIVFLNRGFVTEGTRGAFGLKKPAPSLRVVSRRVEPVASEAPAAERRAPIQESDSGMDPLAEGTRLANQGKFEEARRCCEQSIQRRGPSAEAFYLLGLIHDAVGDSLNALSSYRKALYLDPQHEESLVHLSLLLETLDRKPEAQRLRSRAGRTGFGGTQ